MVEAPQVIEFAEAVREVRRADSGEEGVADEERVSSVVGNEVRGFWCCTRHACKRKGVRSE